MRKKKENKKYIRRVSGHIGLNIPLETIEEESGNNILKVSSYPDYVSNPTKYPGFSFVFGCDVSGSMYKTGWNQLNCKICDISTVSPLKPDLELSNYCWDLHTHFEYQQGIYGTGTTISLGYWSYP